MPNGRPAMPIRRQFGCSAVLALSAFFAASALGQAPSSSSASMEQEIKDLRAENAAVREQLKTLVDTVDKLQRRLDGEPVTVVHESYSSSNAATDRNATGGAIRDQYAGRRAGTDGLNSDSGSECRVEYPTGGDRLASTPVQPESVPAPQTNDDRYRDGIVIWETPEDAKVPFLLKFNVNTQVRYLNTLDSKQTFTDHLGVTHDVHTRNDITVNRSMFILGGYIFDKRAQYSFTVWTSAGAASIVVAGNIGWRFNKALTLTGGYTGVPGSRSLVGTFPFFTATDRSMADNFFRPGFTQGVVGERRTREGTELLGVRRQRSQYPEYLGKQDRYESAGFRQRLVGAAGSLRGTR